MSRRAIAAVAALGLVLGPASLRAQDSACTYRTCGLRIHFRITGPRVETGAGAVVSKPAFGGPSVPLLANGTDSVRAHYAAYRRAGTRGAIVGAVGGVVGLASFFFLHDYSSHQGAFYGLLGVGLAAGIVSGVENARAMSELEQSIWAYNASFTRGP